MEEREEEDETPLPIPQIGLKVRTVVCASHKLV
jgi:hypothetical protein